MRLKLDEPHLSEVVIVSDNAGRYHNNVLPDVLPFIASSTGFALLKYMHGEMCDGKGPCNVQFSICMCRVNAFVSEEA